MGGQVSRDVQGLPENTPHPAHISLVEEEEEESNAEA